MSVRARLRDDRRRAILSVLSDQPIASQEELAAALCALGFGVTQGTLSRDLKALGVGKVPDGAGGSRYQVLAEIDPDGGVGRSRRDFASQLVECRAAGQLVLIFTSPGAAGVLGRIVDELGWPEVEGTLAGDDTVLVVARSPRVARTLRDRLLQWAGISLSTSE